MTWEGLSPPYRTIVADPPWPYEDRFGVGQRMPVRAGYEHNRGVSERGYSTLSIPDLSAMPVAELAEVDAHLYLWTTNTFVADAHAIALSWGFRPITLLTWVKVCQDDRTLVSMRTGFYFRGATEHAWFCVRGSLHLQTIEPLPTAYLWPRITAHSVKPPTFFDLVEKASPGPYVELFARAPRLGWDHWGYGYETAVV